MADSKNTSNEPVVETPAEAPAVTATGGVTNLYFFPDIQKSVEATSLEEAQKLVQSDLDAYAKEGNK